MIRSVEHESSIFPRTSAVAAFRTFEALHYGAPAYRSRCRPRDRHSHWKGGKPCDVRLLFLAGWRYC